MIQTSFKLPERSACVANAHGYGQHEPTGAAIMDLTYPNGVRVLVMPCKHCAVLYVVKP